MTLPLPTVSNIDVTAERLRDVERRRERGAAMPTVGQMATSAVQTADAVVEMGERNRQREEAQWFQREYVDKGWEGAEKMWQEMGAPSDMNPAYWRTAVGDAPAKYFEAVAKRRASEEQARSRKELAAGIKDPNTRRAVELGELPYKDYFAETGRANRQEAAITSREKMGEMRNQIAKDRLEIDRLKASGADPATVTRLSRSYDALTQEIGSLEARAAETGWEDDATKRQLNDLYIRRRNLYASINDLKKRGATPESKDDDPLNLGL